MKSIFSKSFMAIAMVSLVLTGCARNMSANVYTSSSAVGKVLEGTIVSAQQVTIKDNDKLDKNGAGVLGGGLLGAVAGSAIGKGTGRSLATAGAGIAGAVIGSFVQDKLSTSQGVQYVVRLDPKYISSKSLSETKKTVINGSQSIDDDIKGSIGMANTQTDLLSVVQADKIILSPGQRVMVIYNNDRPRVVPAN